MIKKLAAGVIIASVFVASGLLVNNTVKAGQDRDQAERFQQQDDPSEQQAAPFLRQEQQVENTAQNTATETLRVHNDLGYNVDELIIHNLNNDLIPTADDVVSGPADGVARDGYSTCYWFEPGSSLNCLLSFRHDRKLYQRLVANITSSTLINLSDFVEQPEDNHCFGDDSEIDYNDEYRTQLAGSIRQLAEQQHLQIETYG